MGCSSRETTLPPGDCDVPGDPFRAVATATAHLRSTGFDSLRALLLDPATCACVASLGDNGWRERDVAVGRDIATANLGNEGLAPKVTSEGGTQ
ncbi:MAG TPA: hypothetical protein VM366_18305 [Anaerolineae bacterium]|nr:hypothetical protein [Anaerolineae bacterium]